MFSLTAIVPAFNQAPTVAETIRSLQQQAVALAVQRREVGRALVSFPAYFPLRIANAVMMVKAALLELVLQKPFRRYEKGH